MTGKEKGDETASVDDTRHGRIHHLGVFWTEFLCFHYNRCFIRVHLLPAYYLPYFAHTTFHYYFYYYLSVIWERGLRSVLAVTCHQRANEEPNNQNTTLFLSGKGASLFKLYCTKAWWWWRWG